MKHYLRLCIALLITAIYATPLFSNIYEPPAGELQNTEPAGLVPAIKPYLDGVLSKTILSNQLKKQSFDNIQKVNFRILDSLQNGYSYYSFRQQPFMYEPNRQLLMTLKRGAGTIAEMPTNNLNDLYLLVSTDWGNTWLQPINVYSSQSQNLGWARYPSLYPFVDADDMYYVIYTSPITGQNVSPDWGWLGFLNGIYIEGSNEYNLTTGNFTVSTPNGPLEFRWGTDAALVAGFLSDGITPYGLATGNVRTPTGTPRDQNSNIAYRKSDESFAEWQPRIPEPWSSTKYYVNYDEDDAGYSSLTGMELADNNKMIMATLAVFGTTLEGNFPVYAVSESVDYGNTWSQYDIMPKSVLTAFAEANGAVFPDAVRLTFGGYSGTGQSYSISRDMCVLPNGDVSFICLLQDYLTEEQAAQVPDEQRFRKIGEIYRENGVWGVRKIADLDITTILLYRNTDNQWHNQMVYEFQLSRTVDGKYLIAKWTQVFAWDVEGVTDPVLSTDIMCAVREAGKPWSKTVEVTSDIQLDRLTWIPDLIPNDLKNIPIIKVVTKPDPSISENDVVAQRALQNYIEVPQHVLLGHFDADIALNVENNDSYISEVNINSVTPNPTTGEAYVTFTLPTSGNVSLDIFNLMGQKVATIHQGNLTSGTHSIKFNSLGLTQGAYYCVLSQNGTRATKMISVVR